MSLWQITILLLTLVSLSQSLDILSPISTHIDTPIWKLSLQDFGNITASLYFLEDNTEIISSEIFGKIVLCSREFFSRDDFEKIGLSAKGIVYTEPDYNITGRTSVVVPLNFGSFKSEIPIATISGYHHDQLKEWYEAYGELQARLMDDDNNPWVYDGLWVTQLVLSLLYGSVVLLALYRFVYYFINGGTCRFALIVVIMPVLFVSNLVRLVTVLIDPYFRTGNMNSTLMVFLITCTWGLSIMVILLIALFWEESLNNKSARSSAFLVKHRTGYIISTFVFTFLILLLSSSLVLFGSTSAFFFIIFILLNLITILSVICTIIYFIYYSIRILSQLCRFEESNKHSIEATIFIMCSTIGLTLFITGMVFNVIDITVLNKPMIYSMLTYPFQLGGLSLSDLCLCFAFAERLKKSHSKRYSRTFSKKSRIDNN
eukprot:TRINITY_DN5621_c0_g1_i1.p1 TRINITY_DN5621_c0_g1~~TRINITY_DN5621_c0_g1_i1.p1  ORF type:complete len:437 (+),score=42.90 TRINITY_DN5621_c0_g1_i1:23-1312(+)